jgi:hypothetical protein|tara:strand:+ start:17 stop:583 length:567 start_codon:yes stop_codon:yes gene_type:complete
MENNLDTNSFGNKNFIISTLLFLLILSSLGINILNVLGDFVESFTKIFGPLIKQLLSVLGYTAGTVIDETAGVATDVATASIEIAGDSVQSVGTLLKDMSADNINVQTRQELDKSLNNNKVDVSNLNEDVSENPIQKPITSNKTKWCLVGEYEGTRGCVEIAEGDKCMSNQVFPSQKMCLNPTMTNNM